MQPPDLADPPIFCKGLHSYWAEIPALPGCVTERETIEEVTANLKDAIAGWLDVANRRSVESTDQIVEIAVSNLFPANG